MKDKKPRAVNYELIPEHDGEKQTEPYVLLDEVREANHSDIHEAKIAIAWRIALKPDTDGHLVLGKCVKVTDLQKEFADFDFIILLNREIWNAIEFTQKQKTALIDHELCHAAVAYDEESGEPKLDSRGRVCFRIRKHDIEEFTGVVERHGTYKRDLENFARALLKKKAAPLFASDETTVSIGLKDDKGETKFTTPVPLSQFHDAAEKTLKKVRATHTN